MRQFFKVHRAAVQIRAFPLRVVVDDGIGLCMVLPRRRVWYFVLSRAGGRLVCTHVSLDIGPREEQA